MNRLLKFAVPLLAGVALPALAHHSFSMFDAQKELVLKGTIKEFQWSNPHTWIQLDVTDASGKTLEWSIEGGSPNLVGRQGWKRNTFKPGDRVEIASAALGRLVNTVVYSDEAPPWQFGISALMRNLAVRGLLAGRAA